MTTLDDKILGEKLHYYCSSSEGEDEDSDKDDGIEEEDKFNLERSKQEQADKISEKYMNGAPRSHNTGIKGVKEDARLYQRYILEKEQERIDQLTQYAERFSLQPEKAASDSDLDSDDEDFMKSYRQKRMLELKEAEKQPIFGRVFYLTDKNFCETIDNNPPTVDTIVYIYEEFKAVCRRYKACLDRLAQDFPRSKICCMQASHVQMSANFIQNGIPAFLLYRKGDVHKSWLNISEDIGETAAYDELLEGLQERHILPYQ